MPKSNNPFDLINALEDRYKELNMTACSDINASEVIGSSDIEYDYVAALEDAIRNQLGAEKFLNALIKALDFEQRKNLFEYIVKFNNVSVKLPIEQLAVILNEYFELNPADSYSTEEIQKYFKSEGYDLSIDEVNDVWDYVSDEM